MLLQWYIMTALDLPPGLLARQINGVARKVTWKSEVNKGRSTAIKPSNIKGLIYSCS